MTNMPTVAAGRGKGRAIPIDMSIWPGMTVEEVAEEHLLHGFEQDAPEHWVRIRPKLIRGFTRGCHVATIRL